MEEKDFKIEKLLKGVKKNVILKNYTTFQIGGPAQYFFIAKTKQDLIKAIQAAKKNNLPFFILGGGSNLLVSDKGFNGLIIKFQVSSFRFQENIVYSEAGTTLGELVNASVRKGLSGLEWAVGIPGTVGGAIYGNAGAFGKSMGEIIKSVEILDVGKINPPKSRPFSKRAGLRRVKKQDCRFNYRDSIFKHKKNLIILSATLQLKNGDRKEIEKKIKKNLEQRKETQPLNFPSAGSVFKNPSPAQISKKFVAGKSFSAGELIEKCGLKGKRAGRVKISEKHANFIINLGKGQAKDVIRLINLVKKKVKKKFGIELEEEIEFL